MLSLAFAQIDVPAGESVVPAGEWRRKAMPLALFTMPVRYMIWRHCVGKTRSDLTQSIAYSSYLQLTRIDVKTGSKMLGQL